MDPAFPAPANTVSVFDDSAPLTLSFSAATGCGDSQIESAQVEIFDPLNESVDARVDFARSGGNGFASVNVSFLPTMTGYYHVSVTFLPVGGRDQRAVLVVHDRGSTPELSLSRSCASVSRMDNGLLLCGGVSLSDGGVVETFAELNELVIGSGDTAWGYTRNTGRLRRFSASSDRMTLSTDGGAAFFSGIEALLPSEPHEVIALTPSSLVVYREDAGFVSAAGVAQHSAFATKLTGAVFGRWLYLAQPVQVTGPESNGLDSTICGYLLKPNGVGIPDGGEGSCRRFAGEPVAAGKDGIWTWSETARTLRLVAPNESDGGLMVVDSLRIPIDLTINASEPDFSQATRPTFRQLGSFIPFIPRRQRDRIVVDHFRTQQTVDGAQDDVVWLSQDNGTNIWSTHP